MTENRSAAGDILRHSFLDGFANDGTIDAGELAFMEELALRDGMVDDAERKVLAVIFARVRPETLTPEVWQQVLAFKAQHGIG